MESRESMAGIMSPPSCFSVILQKGLAAHTQPMNYNSTSNTRPANSTGQNRYDLGSTPSNNNMNNASGGDPVKRKRGRPRKYAPDGSLLSPSSTGQSPPVVSSPPPTSSHKKARGRPSGSGKKQQLAALGTGGLGFTPHVIMVGAGEDVAMKVMSFSQQGPRAVCILSANGAISNATLRQSATSGGMVTYEGRFEILSLSGSFLPTENSGIISRTGGLSVSLAGPNGQVIGGGVAGLLMAASPVQVIVGSFVYGDTKTSDGESPIVNLNAAFPSVVPKPESPSTANANAQQYHNHGNMASSTAWATFEVL